MKKLIAATLICASLAGCTQRENGKPCVGLMDKEDKASGEYDISFWNVFLAVIFSETIVVPVIVVGYMLECPVE